MKYLAPPVTSERLYIQDKKRRQRDEEDREYIKRRALRFPTENVQTKRQLLELRNKVCEHIRNAIDMGYSIASIANALGIPQSDVRILSNSKSYNI